ncbi:MAG: methyltransferase family protein [Paracoccaceae bacterium]
MSSDYLVIFDTTLRLFVFGAFTIASYRHFIVPSPEPIGMRLIRITSILAFMANIYIVIFCLKGHLSPTLTVLSIFITSSSFVLFQITINTTKKSELHIAYSTRASERLIRNGPFSYVRHPFYAAYIMFWMSWTMATQSYVSTFLSAILALQYLLAIFFEERSLKLAFGEEYDQYRSQTSALIPRVW